MAVFSYTAVDKAGKQIKGTLEAETKTDAIAELKNNGNLVISIDETGILSKDIGLPFGTKKPKARDLAVFCHQFVSIIDAGVPAVTALAMLGEQTESKPLARAILECKKSIEEGETLARAMGYWPDVFPSMLVTLVEAGEASGSLSTSFARMAVQFEKEEKIKATIKKATVYPTFIICLAIVAVAGMLTFIVPSFASMLTDLDVKMPALTTAVLAAASFFQHRWYIVLTVVLLLVFGTRTFAHSEKGKYFFGKISLNLPLFGELARKTASARMARTLETLLKSGLPLADALSIVSNTMTNVYFRDTILSAREAVLLGSSLSSQFSNGEMFPPLVRHMIGIGEETGSLEEMLTKLADYYEEEVEDVTTRLMAALEPAIILVVALLIGTIIIAMILPMASMYSGLNNL